MTEDGSNNMVMPVSPMGNMGRYTSRDGYSGHDKGSMIEGLREKMHMATNDSDREAIRRAIDILER